MNQPGMRRAGALQAYEEGLAIRRRLAAADPSNTEWQRDVSVSLDKSDKIGETELDKLVPDHSIDEVRFEPNTAQLKFLDELHALNIILKARQLGFTTLCCLIYLDACVFTPHTRAGVIAHKLEDANRPGALRRARPRPDAYRRSC